MKIRLCAALLMVLLSVPMLMGCAAGVAMEAVDTAQDIVEEVIVPDVPPKAELPKEDPAAPKESLPADTRPPAFLSREEAEAIALNHAGFAENQVAYLHTEFELDDGIAQYDVSFREGYWEYEYEIHAETGAVLSFEKDD